MEKVRTESLHHRITASLVISTFSEQKLVPITILIYVLIWIYIYYIYALLFHSHVPIPKLITSLTQSQCFLTYSSIVYHSFQFFIVFSFLKLCKWVPYLLHSSPFISTSNFYYVLLSKIHGFSFDCYCYLCIYTYKHTYICIYISMHSMESI